MMFDAVSAWLCVIAVIGVQTTLPVQAANDTVGRCMWYGVCKGGQFNCLYNGTEKVLKDQPNGAAALEKLRKRCPWMYTGESTRTCCDPEQVNNLDMGISSLEGLFGTCPSCLFNFRKVLCGYTCGKNNSAFMRATATKVSNETGTPRTYITNVTVAVAAEALESTWSSCNNVLFSGVPAVNVACGATYSASKTCPANAFWYGMGHSSAAPFVLDIVSSGSLVKGLTPQPYDTIPCTQAVPGHLYSCPCQTCPARKDCHRQPVVHKQAKEQFVITIDGVAFIMGCIFLTFLFVFTVLITYNRTVRQESPIVNRFQQSGELKPVADAIERSGSKLRQRIDAVLGYWCQFCTRNPLKVLVVSLAIAGGLCSGIVVFQVVTDPVLLWSAPASEFRQQKDIFDRSFAPFYRTEQIIITLDSGLPTLFNRTDTADNFCDVGVQNYTIGSVLRQEILRRVLQLHQEIEAIAVESDDATTNGTRIEDICFAPLSPDNKNCATESVLQYWQHDLAKLDKVHDADFSDCITANYVDHLEECVLNPLSPQSVRDSLALPCIGDFGGPAYPNVVLGGYNAVAYTNATALVLTYPINNYVDEAKNSRAEAWEEKFLDTVRTFNKTVSFYTKQQCHLFPECDNKTNIATVQLHMAYSAQRSIPDEVSRESKSDILVIGLSYTLMFVYVAISLGKVAFHHPIHLMIDAKISLALAGVLMVLLAVGASIGSLALIGVRATLIVFEVVPFLVLAVGVDNLFLMVQALQRDTMLEYEDKPAQVARVLRGVAPSLTLSALAESVAFFCGALSDIPAVHTFSLYAGLAVMFNYLLQMSAFVALLSLDARRQESQRMDICCCLPVRKKNYEQLGDFHLPGILYRFIKECYAPVLLSKYVRPAVICTFFGLMCMSVVATTNLEIGLEQTTALPQDSYLIPYFNNISRYLKVGAPVYFVIDGEYPYDEMKYGGRVCSAGGNCSQSSLGQQIFRASEQPELTTIAQPAMSWIDNYYQWVSPASGCCKIRTTSDGGFEFCSQSDKDPNCTDCLPTSTPSPEEFDMYLEQFLVSNPDQACPLGGHAAFNSAVKFGKATNKSGNPVAASYFMTYHTPANDSNSFINAIHAAQTLAKKITKVIDYPGVKVFPYSVFYVFYGQYLNLVNQAIINLTLATVALFTISFFMLAMNIKHTLFILLTVWMIIVDVMGVMYLWDIKFNAISLVNLVVAMGIAVEFCVHIVSTFSGLSVGDRLECAKEALSTTGSSVFSGITLTKFGGVVVLAFTKSRLFQVYYFRMYMAIVGVGAAHGLIFLPVLLSYVG